VAVAVKGRGPSGIPGHLSGYRTGAGSGAAFAGTKKRGAQLGAARDFGHPGPAQAGPFISGSGTEFRTSWDVDLLGGQFGA